MKTNKHTKVLYYHVVDTSCAGQCECSEGGLVGQCCADLHFMTQVGLVAVSVVRVTSAVLTCTS